MGEADRLVTMLSPEYGQLRAIAKGVRRTTGKLTGHIELLNQVSVSVAEGRNLDVIVEAQCIDSFPGLQENLDRLSTALYLAELADSFSVPEGHKPPDAQGRSMYELLVGTFSLLAAGEHTHKLVLYFQLALLKLSGLSPEIAICVECGKPLEKRDHGYSARAGGITCPTCMTGLLGPFRPASVSVIKVLRYYRERTLIAALDLDVPIPVLVEARELLDAHLRNHLDREVRSRRFIEVLGGDSR